MDPIIWPIVSVESPFFMPISNYLQYHSCSDWCRWNNLHLLSWSLFSPVTKINISSFCCSFYEKNICSCFPMWIESVPIEIIIHVHHWVVDLPICICFMPHNIKYPTPKYYLLKMPIDIVPVGRWAWDCFRLYYWCRHTPSLPAWHFFPDSTCYINAMTLTTFRVMFLPTFLLTWRDKPMWFLDKDTVTDGLSWGLGGVTGW